MTLTLSAWPALLSFFRREEPSVPPAASDSGEQLPLALNGDLGLPPPCNTPHSAEALHSALLR